MPRRKTHEKISKLLLGVSYPEIDKTLDLPVIIVGSSHRKYLHTFPEAIATGLLLTGTLKGAAYGTLHVFVDKIDTAAKKEVNKLTRGETKCQKKRKQKTR